VAHERSDALSESKGPLDLDPPTSRTHDTALARVVLSFGGDGGWTMVATAEGVSAAGSWEEKPRLSLEAADTGEAVTDLEYAYRWDDQIHLGLRRAPDDEHRDVWALTFRRDEPVVGPPGAALLASLLECDDIDAMYERLEEADREKDSDAERSVLARALWNAAVDGRWAADPESDGYWDQVSLLGDDEIKEVEGAFTHDHAEHMLRTVDPEEQDDLRDVVVDALVTLPEDPRDAELTALMTKPWVEDLVRGRFLGGGAPEAIFARAFMPQPLTDDLSRAYVTKTTYTRPEAIEGLFAPDHPDLPRVLLHDRGRGFVARSMDRIDRFDLADPCRTLAHEILADAANAGSAGRWQSALILAVLLREDPDALSPLVDEAFGVEIRGMMFGSPDDEEKRRLRESIASLPDAQRAAVEARLYLIPKT
jgi:hypothetical protein